MMTLTELLSHDVDAASVTDHIAVHDVGGVAIVTLARPEQHNVLNLASWRRLLAIFGNFADQPKLRTVVIRSAGDRAFGAGADVKEFPDVRLTPVDALDYNESIAAALQAIGALPVPVIAMIAGLAVGGGCELAAACDVRIASADSLFGIPIGRLGVTLGYAEANAVARIIGPDALKHLLFGGHLITADEALRLGLVQRVVDRTDLVTETVQLIDAILASSEVTIRAAKLVADMCGRTLTAADTEALTRITVEAYGGADLKEGVVAFQAGRAPQFSTRGRGPQSSDSMKGS